MRAMSARVGMCITILHAQIAQGILTAANRRFYVSYVGTSDGHTGHSIAGWLLCFLAVDIFIDGVEGVVLLLHG